MAVYFDRDLVTVEVCALVLAHAGRDQGMREAARAPWTMLRLPDGLVIFDDGPGHSSSKIPVHKITKRRGSVLLCQGSNVRYSRFMQPIWSSGTKYKGGILVLLEEVHGEPSGRYK